MRTALSKYLLVIAMLMLITLIICVTFLPGYLSNLGKNVPVPETKVSPAPTVSFSISEQPVIGRELPVMPQAQTTPAEGEREYKSSRIRAFFKEPVKESKEMKSDEIKEPAEIPSAPPAPEDAGY